MEFTNTNLNLYKTFVLVYETKNLTRASELLKITRTGIGQNIKELSKQLGVTLFIPQQRGVEPTSEADTLYPTIKKAIESIIETEGILCSLKDKKLDVVRMVVVSSLADFYIKQYIKEFYSKYPKIQLEFSKQVDSKTDFVIDLESSFQDKSFKTIELFNGHGAFIVSKEFVKKHGLAKEITLNEFLRLPLIARAGAWQEFIRQSGVNANPFVTKTASSEATHLMVKNSLGVGLSSKDLLEKLSDKNIVEIKVKDLKMPYVKIVCAYQKELSQSAKKFIDGLIQYCSLSAK